MQEKLQEKYMLCAQYILYVSYEKNQAEVESV